jgi:HNH endonuclease
MFPARFLSKIEKVENGCWLWVASHLPNGYGRFNWNGRAGYAHRYAYEAAHGVIPDGMSICHTCDVRDCVNPDHLFAATHRENMRDMVSKGRGH